MFYYFAPMEGITGYIVRNAYQHCFGKIDRYFTPFIPANKRMNHKILRDILPENNKGITLIPQLMANQASDVLNICKELNEYGYDTFNLNLGCPSGTVVSKKRGAGFLAYPEELDSFLYEIYEKSPYKISIKTRIGLNTPSEWERLCSIYSKYPLEELIIHPRTQSDLYRNPPHPEAFCLALEKITAPLCYNGDITSAAAFRKLCETFPKIDRVMIGRGLLTNPGLIGEICGEPPITKDTLLIFHDEILSGYLSAFSGEKDVLFHMKELWFYLGNRFVSSEKHMKKLKKSQTMTDYRIAADSIFRDLELYT